MTEMNMADRLKLDNKVDKIMPKIPTPQTSERIPMSVITFKPFITMLMCCRKKDNPDHDIEKFLGSVKEFGFKDNELQHIELLVKFDSDDDMAQRVLLNRNITNPGAYDQPNVLKTYPFRSRVFKYARGEGRFSLHNDYKFLFSQRNPCSKFIMFVTDDCFFIKQGIFKLLQELKNKDYVILGDREPEVKKYFNYHQKQDWRFDVSPYPIVSSKLLEITQNIGWQTNLDNWLTLLHVILYHKYGLDIWKGIPKFIDRSPQADQNRPPTYNPMEITNLKMVNNAYYFTLVEQQAKNIYLNYIEKDMKKMCETIQKVIK